MQTAPRSQTGGRLFATGFGPFGEFAENPSALLAEGSSLPFRILEVSFQAVEQALDDLALEGWDRLMLIGVAGNADKMRLESVARNWIGSTADVRGVVAGPGPIDPTGPRFLHGLLWAGFADTDKYSVTTDAGTYLCNYALFRAIQRFPERTVGFLHVPPVAKVALEAQRATLNSILTQLIDQAA